MTLLGEVDNAEAALADALEHAVWPDLASDDVETRL